MDAGTPARRVVVTDAPAAGDLAALRQRIVEHNTEQHRFEEVRPLACFVHDPEGALLAGASGYTWWGWLTIGHVWVAAQERGSGLGAAVLGAAEDEARRRHCRAVWLDTFSFQARPFYERLGYEQFGELLDFPPGATRHFMWKRL